MQFLPARSNCVRVFEGGWEGSPASAGDLRPTEIEAVAALLDGECGTMSTEDMSKAVANLLGFRRRGGEPSQVILKGDQEFERESM
ncbi:hypothetical protein GCM10019059_40910 [Camelimonas fluminis]|nr:hypothetical protein GCM10019059_40910 [Camelimonas fluminis]